MREFLGFDDDWRRPLPAEWWRRDAVIALVFFLGAILGLEIIYSLGGVTHLWPRAGLVAATLVGVVPLVWRRRYPVAVMLLLAAHMFVFGTIQSAVMSNMAMQAAYFFSIFTAMAWGRDRRVTALAAAGVLTFMFGWVAVQLAVASSRDSFMELYGSAHTRVPGALFGPATATVLYVVMINVLFFLTAVTTGANNWRGARARARAEEQAHTIAEQSTRLADQAVVEERLRIARELHDVVAHHVSAMGVQAAAARKLLNRRPDAAAEALTNVETSSRQAVTEMRALLGTLRSGESTTATTSTGGTADGSVVGVTGGSDAPSSTSAGKDSARATRGESPSRAPEPGVDDLASLVESARAAGLDVQYTQVMTPRRQVPAAVGHSIYRTVQEALANVRRHSSATRASVTVRTGDDGSRPYVEAEILDDGRPRAGTSGSGLGLLGMRERVRAHHGSADIGPRITGGYRVRVRLPLEGARPDDAGRKAQNLEKEHG